jgi:hypothetical protein
MSVAAWDRAEVVADFFTRKSARVSLAGVVASVAADDTGADGVAGAAGVEATAVEVAAAGCTN